MNNFIQTLIVAALGGFVAAALVVTFVDTPQAAPAGSPVGSSFTAAKIAAVNISPATAGATSTSILNSDGSARWVLSGFTSCTGTGSSQTFLTGAGLAAFRMQAATTSVANLGAQGNVNFAINMIVSTSTALSNNATTTSNSNFLAYWPTGTYMTFTFNATNTAACTAGVYYIAS